MPRGHESTKLRPLRPRVYLGRERQRTPHAHAEREAIGRSEHATTQQQPRITQSHRFRGYRKPSKRLRAAALPKQHRYLQRNQPAVTPSKAGGSPEPQLLFDHRARVLAR